MMATGAFTHRSYIVHKTFISNNVHRNAQKSYKIFKPRLHSTCPRYSDKYCKNFNWLSLYLIGCVRFGKVMSVVNVVKPPSVFVWWIVQYHDELFNN